MNYPPQYPQQAPAYPPQGYPQQAPQYPPQQGYPPQAPPYPSQDQGFYPPPPQSYAPPAPNFQPPVAPPARGTIDDFYDQPAASGKSISFDKKAPGTSYAGVVARSITGADIQVQTDMVTKQPAKHPDGRLKYTMVIPLLLAPSAEFPDGRAAWYVKHNEKPELNRAMEAAGCKPGTPPEQGALITITYTGDRPVPGMNAQKMKTVTYQRPQNAAGNGNGNGHAQQQQPAPVAQQYPEYAPQPAPAQAQYEPQQAPQQPYPPQPAPQYQQDPGYYSPPAQPPPVPQAFAQPPQGPPPAAPVQPQFEPPAPQQPAQPPMQPPAPQQPAQPPMQPPAGLTPEQQQLLATLTGQG
jgi:hypothetical protein